MTKEDDEPMTIAEMIRQARQRVGLSQVAFGAIVGVSGAAVSRWENGNRTPPASVLRLYARELGPAWERH